MSDTSTTSANGGSSAPERRESNSTKPPTVAAFSPTSHSFPSTRQRSTILVHQKSPLLLATPPQVTRALAYSHPFIVPLNKLVGLLSWTTGDAWESFLFVAAFWFTVLYGGYILRYTGPLILVTLLIVGMYFRRYSPLSSTGWTGEKKKGHKRDHSDGIKHRKSLDEILSTLQTFTTRCNILLDPLLRLTDFLSTQQTATSATTQPALTTLFIRIMLTSPLWWALTLPPLRIITTKRIVLVFGTILMSWHSRPARISRTILWRSKTVRDICTIITGLDLGVPSAYAPPLPPRPGTKGAVNVNAKPNDTGEGIRFTFTLHENQRRWLGIGWTASMLAYERNSWTDEHLNPTADPAHFELPEVDGGMAKWQWVDDSEWYVELPSSKKNKSKDAALDDDDAWIYYDNKWRDGRRGQDGWGRYTRRRKWLRDAELVDVVPEEEKPTPAAKKEKKKPPPTPPRPTPSRNHSNLTQALKDAPQHAPTPSMTTASTITTGSDVGSPSSSYKRKSWLPGSSAGSRNRATSSASGSTEGKMSRAALGTDDVVPPVARLKNDEADWGLGDDVSMGLG
ncbi:Pex24p-domain-containing protein [Aureobasidium subglaciale]|nr:Pex24p-domain-containing protein [Aureobasidium subglaciale]